MERAITAKRLKDLSVSSMGEWIKEIVVQPYNEKIFSNKEQLNNMDGPYKHMVK